MKNILVHARRIPRLYATIGCIVVGTAFLTVWQTRHIDPVYSSSEVQTEKRKSTCEHLFLSGEDALDREALVPNEALFTGTPALVQFSRLFPEAYTYRSLIRAEVKKGANFAGHYTVVAIGCGTNCATHAIVDTQTGQLVAFGLPTTMGASFTVNSRLLILNPKEGFPSFDQFSVSERDMRKEWSTITRQYYMIEETSKGTALRLVCNEHPFDGQPLSE